MIQAFVREVRQKLQTLKALLEMIGFLLQRRKRLSIGIGICTLACLVLLGVALTLVLFFVCIVWFIYSYQDSLLYFPDQPDSSRVFVQTPNASGLQFENVYIMTSDGERLNAFFIKQQSPAAFASAYNIVYFHGNAGNIGHRLHNALALYVRCHVNILLVEYRGYGKSSGSPSERGFITDAEAAVTYLTSRGDVASDKVVLFGRSLGGAVAAALASRPHMHRKIAAVILENTFTSIPDMARLFFPISRFLPNFFFRSCFLTSERITRITIPVLFLSGLSDELIPSTMMSQLFELCRSQSKFIEQFQTGTHNMTWRCPGYYEAVGRFLVALPALRQATKAKELHGHAGALHTWGSGVVGHNLNDNELGVGLVDVWAAQEGSTSTTSITDASSAPLPSSSAQDPPPSPLSLLIPSSPTPAPPSPRSFRSPL